MLRLGLRREIHAAGIAGYGLYAGVDSVSSRVFHALAHVSYVAGECSDLNVGIAFPEFESGGDHGVFGPEGSVVVEVHDGFVFGL